MKKILVTGSAGFIGSHLCEHLISQGYDVVGIDNFDPFYRKEYKIHNHNVNLGKDNYTFFEVDLKKKDLLVPAFTDVGVVIHLAGKAGVRPSIEDPGAYIDNNIIVTQNILDVMKENGIKKMLFASSSSVYGNNPDTPWSEELDVNNPISPYAFTKKACELQNHTYHHLYGMDILNLRFFTVFGPRQRPDLAIHKFIKMMFRGEPIPMFGDGSTSRDYTYVKDTVSGITGALEYIIENDNVFDVVNLGHNHPVKLIDLINAIGKATGKTPVIERKPMQPGDVNVTYADIKKAKLMFGYNPRTPLEEGLSRFVEWFRENPGMLKLD
ncbi:MAG: NAD-dependent epimerase/dehydratase family protein [Chlorobi bacterium]|nr:NAD-dependent epimerase/dehydratase family protein [Chlorobiota bacterium]